MSTYFFAFLFILIKPILKFKTYKEVPVLRQGLAL